MKLPVSWLADHVEIPWSTAELARRLTQSGFEVEGIEPAAADFTQVVVAQIDAVSPHPEADRLRLCRVNDGSGQHLQIVCGAANARVGLKAPLARIGAVLPGELRIGRSKLRGVDSEGMLCSQKDLGMAAQSSGLWELPAELEVGQDLRRALSLDDAVLEFKVYANRGDAMSIRGVAREIAVLTGQALRSAPLHDAITMAAQSGAGAQASSPGNETASVPALSPGQIEAPEAAARFLTCRVSGVDNQAVTPLWMQERLRRAGLRSISPVVDITNYVMLETGQPMHAYDEALINGSLGVRWARAGETLTLLDERALTLTGDELVITDAKGPVGLAGIMGGQGTAIRPESNTLVLEVAWFNPDAIAGRARRFGLTTDAGQRFERGVDPAGQERAMALARGLLQQVCGGRSSAITDLTNTAHLPRRPSIVLRRQRLLALAGVAFADSTVETSLGALGLTVKTLPDGWEVQPPSWRFDLSIEADLIEEVLRIVGFDAVNEAPHVMAQRFSNRSESVVDESAWLDALVARGYHEAIHYAFVDRELQRKLFPDRAAVRLSNPIASDQDALRVTLWVGLLKSAGENLRRQQTRIRLFEQGTAFTPDAARVIERQLLSGCIVGGRKPEQWAEKTAAADFHDLKSDVESVLDLASGAEAAVFEPSSLSCLHPGRQAQIRRQGLCLGFLGQLHPRLAAELDLPEDVWLFELNIMELQVGVLPRFEAISRFPQIRRDLAITLPKSTPLSALTSRVTVSAGSVLKGLNVFDVYEGPGIETTRKSIALGLIFQDNLKTLSDGEADALVQRILADVNVNLDAKLRD